jgi:serine/threonine protein kinase/TolB-like protein/tetratricopeptide (TPR) repeat protein
MIHSADRWKLIETLFYESLELPSESRAGFLEQRCGTDSELRKEIEALLNSADKPMDLLQRPIADAAENLVADSAVPVIAPGKTINHYEILSLLGTGGMGQVYLAMDTRLKRQVAIKILSPELTHDERGLRRFEQEARAASALNHPNILTIYEFGAVEGVHFIASEFVEGPTLRQELVAGRLPLDTALDIAAQIARALAAAHASGIVHRDIKPENVMIRKDALVKLLDFGIAKLSESQSSATIRAATRVLSVSLSQAGMVIGSTRYMSPEQARGLVVDTRSDIFSLGVVLYEMIAGKAPFDGQNASDVIAEILKACPPALSSIAPNVPVEFQAIVEKAMHKERESRYQTITEMLSDLENLQREMQFRATLEKAIASNETQPGLPEPRTPQAVRRDLLSAASGAAALSKSSVQRVRGRQLALAFFTLAGLALAYFAFVVRKNNVAETAAPPRSLAILPFRNLRQDPSVDFLDFSLSDAVISKLGYIGSLTVRPSSSVDKYKNQSVDPQKVGAELNVDTLLTGSFLKDADQLRITAQLIDVKPDKILWEDSFDVQYDKLLTVQDRVAQEIVKGLELHLSPAEAQHLKPENPIDAQAYEYYLRGIDLYSSNDFHGAIGALEKAASLAPDYAPAWAHLGRAYSTNASLQFGGREQYDKAQEAYEKAISLDPSLVEPRIYMANMLTDTGRVEQAVPLLRAALESGPNNAELHWELGYAYRFAGMLQESVAECEKARQNNPEVKINSSALNSYLYLGEYEKFLQSLPSNDSAYVRFYRGFGEYYLDRRAQAAQDFDRAYTLDSSLLPVRLGKALSDSIAGRPSEALRLLRQTQNEMEERGVGDAEGMYKLAQVYAVLGNKAAALHMFSHTVEGGFFCYPYFTSDPLLAHIRGEAEFQRLLGLARERHEQFRARFF